MQILCILGVFRGSSYDLSSHLLKKSFIMLETYSWRILAETFKLLQLSLIFMAERLSVNMAVFWVKAKLIRTLSDSAKCWRLLGKEVAVRLKTDSSFWTNKMLVLSEIY